MPFIIGLSLRASLEHQISNSMTCPFPQKMEIHSYGKKGCDLINIMDIDDYIISLLAKEMNNQWHIEALKAQAVAAKLCFS